MPVGDHRADEDAYEDEVAAPMKIKSPIVTLLVGLLIAVVVWTLSVRAHNDAKNKPYGAPAAEQVVR